MEERFKTSPDSTDAARAVDAATALDAGTVDVAAGASPCRASAAAEDRGAIPIPLSRRRVPVIEAYIAAFLGVFLLLAFPRFMNWLLHSGVHFANAYPFFGPSHRYAGSALFYADADTDIVALIQLGCAAVMIFRPRPRWIRFALALALVQTVGSAIVTLAVFAPIGLQIVPLLCAVFGGYFTCYLWYCLRWITPA